MASFPVAPNIAPEAQNELITNEMAIVEEIIDEPDNSLGSEDNDMFCSCVRYAHHLNPKIPLVDAQYFASFKLSQVPTLGSFAIFKYKNGTHHIGKVSELKENTFIVKDANFKRCKEMTREISYDHYAILGFFTP